MSLIRWFISAFSLTTPMFLQGADPLLGEWSRSITQKTILQTGRIAGSTSEERTIEFNSDQTATISTKDVPGATKSGLKARWSDGPDKLTVQPDGLGPLSGAIKGNSLKLTQGPTQSRCGRSDPNRLDLPEA